MSQTLSKFRALIAVCAMMALALPMMASSVFAQATPEASPAAEGTPMASPVAEPVVSEGDEYGAYLVFSSCDALAENAEMPEVYRDLSPATIQPGEYVGMPGGTTAASSSTLLELTLDDLIVDSDLSVVITTAGDDPQPLGCAPVGGVLDEDGAISVVMEALPGHQSNGMVYISNKEEGTVRITIWVHPDN